MKLYLDVRCVLSEFKFSQDHQRVGRTGDTCQSSTISVDAY